MVRRSGHKRLGKKIAEITRDLAQLRQQLSELGPSQALADRISRIERDLGSRVAMLEEGQESLNVRMDSHFQELTGVYERLNYLEQVRVRVEKFPWVGLVVAIVIGIVAGVLWHGYDFSVKVVGTVTEMTVPAWQDKTWAAWLFGFFVFLGVFGLLSTLSGVFNRSETVDTPSTAQADQPAPDRTKTAEQFAAKV